MKKLLWKASFLVPVLFTLNSAYAQPVFIADLELLPEEDEVTSFVMEPGDTLELGLRFVNHGPDDIDTSGYVLFGFDDFPYFLVMQSFEGDKMPLAGGDTVLSRGINLIYDAESPREADTTIEMCFYSKVNLDPEEFIHDDNQSNDTICIAITYKKGEVSAIKDVATNNRLKIWPNPASGEVHIPLNAGHKGAISINIASMEGRSVFSGTVQAGTLKDWRLETSSWTPGLYVLTLVSERLTETGRFIIR